MTGKEWVPKKKKPKAMFDFSLADVDAACGPPTALADVDVGPPLALALADVDADPPEERYSEESSEDQPQESVHNDSGPNSLSDHASEMDDEGAASEHEVQLAHGGGGGATFAEETLFWRGFKFTRTRKLDGLIVLVNKTSIQKQEQSGWAFVSSKQQFKTNKTNRLGGRRA